MLLLLFPGRGAQKPPAPLSGCLHGSYAVSDKALRAGDKGPIKEDSGARPLGSRGQESPGGCLGPLRRDLLERQENKPEDNRTRIVISTFLNVRLSKKKRQIYFFWLFFFPPRIKVRRDRKSVGEPRTTREKGYETAGIGV